MQYKLHSFFALAALGLGSLTINAQTVSTFEDVVLAGVDTTYLETKFPVDGIYTYESGNVKFYGSVSWGTSWANFNCSNGTDTVETSYAKTAACIVGAGQDVSDNYGIAYVPIDFMGPDPTATIPVGAKLLGDAAGNRVAGVYVTNSVYAYRYILNGGFYAANNHWFKLIIRGYLNGVAAADSVNFTLADYTNAANPVLVNTWEWVDLTNLGNVDSVTFDLISSDAGQFGINTPAYFAIDNLTTLDGDCPQATSITAVSINENSATINWTNSVTGIDVDYEVAVDQSATLAPTATAVAVTSATFSATSLQENTVYYMHVRSTCDAGFSDWDTASFKTLAGTGLFDKNTAGLSVSISPNPAQDVLHINAATIVNAEIYNLEGKRLMSVTKAKDINIAALPAGLYMLRVIDEKGKEHNTLRFSKKN